MAEGRDVDDILKLLVPIGVAIIGSVLGFYFNLFGFSAVIIISMGFAIIVLSVYVLRLRSQIERQAAEDEPTPLTAEEKDRLKEELRNQLEEIPSLREIHPHSQEAVKLREWRRRTLALLEKAYGEYTAEVEDFEELSFRRFPDHDLNEAQAILKVAIEIQLGNQLQTGH